MQSAVGIALISLDGRWLAVNPAVCTLLGYSEAEILRRSVLDVTHPDDHAITADAIEELGSGDSGTRAVEKRYVRKDGTHAWARVNASVVRDDGGRPQYWVSQLEDITEQVQQASDLRIMEARFRAAFDQAPIGVALLHLDGHFMQVNRAYCELLGYTEAELIGVPTQIVTHPDDWPADLARMRHLLACAGEVAQTRKRYIRRNGDIVWTRLTASVISDAAGRPAYFMGQVQDITPQEQLSAALAVSENRLRNVLTRAPIVLFSVDRSGNVSIAEPGTHKSEGIVSPRNAEASLHAWLASSTVWLDSWQRALAGESFSTIVEPGEDAFDVWWTPERDGFGAVVGVTGLAVNVTDTVRAQRATQREQAAALRLAQTRSDFVAAVSHELRTPLTSIIGYGEVLQARWQSLSDPQRLKFLGRVVLSANRQKRLVDDLLLLSRLEDRHTPLHADPVHVESVVQRVIFEIQGSYPGQQVMRSGSGDLHVWADQERLLQILVNLADNAAKYSPEDSPIYVRWDREDGTAVIRVRDEGCGIPEAGLGQLFTRFGRLPGSRIRSGRVGTGLGLYLGRTLAQAMGGTLDLEHTGPSGSTFRLRLPAVACS